MKLVRVRRKDGSRYLAEVIGPNPRTSVREPSLQQRLMALKRAGVKEYKADLRFNPRMSMKGYARGFKVPPEYLAAWRRTPQAIRKALREMFLLRQSLLERDLPSDVRDEILEGMTRARLALKAYYKIGGVSA